MMRRFVFVFVRKQKIYGLYGLKHHIVEISGDVTDAAQTNSEQGKIELLSFWMLDAEFSNNFDHQGLDMLIF